MCGRHFGNFLIPALASVLVADSTKQNQTGTPAVARPVQTITCSACQIGVSPTFTWCPHCGQALKPHPCAYCGRILEVNERNCPSCGAPGGKR